MPLISDLRRNIRPIFRQQFGYGFALLAPLGIALMSAGFFNSGDACFITLGVWGIGCWLNIPFLVRRRSAIAARQVRRNPDRLIRALRSYRLWKYGGIVAVTALTSASVFYVNLRRLDVAQEDVYINLDGTESLRASGNPYFSVFTVKNRGKYGITSHSISCHPNLIVGMKGTSSPACTTRANAS